MGGIAQVHGAQKMAAAGQREFRTGLAHTVQRYLAQ